MSTFLSNNDILLINNNRIATLNNIKQILTNNLQAIYNNTIQKKHEILNFNNDFNSLQDYETEYMKLKYYNINMSLDIINKYKNIINQNNFFYFYNKNINLQFKNYSIHNIIDAYISIIKNLLKKINIDDFTFNIKFLNNEYPKMLSMHEFLKINMQTQLNDVTIDTSIIDFYLINIENTPESYNEIYNYIFFLRKFPLFIKMINKYLEMYENIIYQQIISNNLDFIIPNKTYFDPYLNFNESNKLLHNIFVLTQEKYSINDIFYNLYNIKKLFSKKDIYETYISLNFLEYGIDDNTGNIINSNILYQKLKSIENTIDEDYNILVCLYLKNNNVYPDTIKEISEENLQLITSKLLINTYMIFQYLNLNQYENMENLVHIYYVHKDNSVYDFNINLNILDNILLYIYISFCFFKEHIFYNCVSINLTFLKHFFYIYSYFKNNIPDQFPLFMFLLCSNEKNKIIYEYKNYYLLDFFVEFYDIIFKNSDKYLFKNH